MKNTLVLNRLTLFHTTFCANNPFQNFLIQFTIVHSLGTCIVQNEMKKQNKTNETLKFTELN